MASRQAGIQQAGDCKSLSDKQCSKLSMNWVNVAAAWGLKRKFSIRRTISSTCQRASLSNSSRSWRPRSSFAISLQKWTCHITMPITKLRRKRLRKALRSAVKLSPLSMQSFRKSWLVRQRPHQGRELHQRNQECPKKKTKEMSTPQRSRFQSLIWPTWLTFRAIRTLTALRWTTP